MALSDTTRAALMTVSTATLCTALFKRGLRNQFIQDVRPLNQGLAIMVGEAFTLRYIPAREDLNPITVFQDRTHPQRVAVEQCPPGAVTDGGFRDSHEIAAMPFPTCHQRPSAPTNLTLHQALDINVPVGCGDVAVFPGDVLVGDGEGVVVLPAHLADALAGEAVEMTAFEDFVIHEVRQGQSILGLYPATDEQAQADFAAWRQSTAPRHPSTPLPRRTPCSAP